jgi:hypothetical protein
LGGYLVAGGGKMTLKQIPKKQYLDRCGCVLASKIENFLVFSISQHISTKLHFFKHPQLRGKLAVGAADGTHTKNIQE